MSRGGDLEVIQPRNFLFQARHFIDAASFLNRKKKKTLVHQKSPINNDKENVKQAQFQIQ